MAQRGEWAQIWQSAPLWVAALWWGSLSALMLLVVPLLFVHLPSPALAGATAAKLFTAQNWLGAVCGLLLLMFSRSNLDFLHTESMKFATFFVVGGMLVALLLEFAVAPRIVSRENLRLWHSVGIALLIVQWLCASATLNRLFRSLPAF